jgi:hypothetical protein
MSGEQARLISLGLSFLPFAGIDFLWYLGVIRDRLGMFEDQFFSTLFLGSGLLYIAFTFASAAIAGGLILVFSMDTNILAGSEGTMLAWAISSRLNSVYAVRMAGMFMLVLGTIWVRTGVMPRWLVLVTYGLALALLFMITFSHWLTLVFPAWVLLVSLYILWSNYRYQVSDSQQPSEE